MFHMKINLSFFKGNYLIQIIEVNVIERFGLRRNYIYIYITIYREIEIYFILITLEFK